MSVIKENYGQICAKHNNVYYAHHRYKYGTKVEEYELNLIRSSVIPDAKIFNPSTDLDVDGRSEESIMKDCIEEVKKSDIVVFSSMDGVIGIGVYTEIMEASTNYIPVYYIYQNSLRSDWSVRVIDDGSRNDKLYAYVNVQG